MIGYFFAKKAAKVIFIDKVFRVLPPFGFYDFVFQIHVLFRSLLIRRIKPQFLSPLLCRKNNRNIVDFIQINDCKKGAEYRSFLPDDESGKLLFMQQIRLNIGTNINKM